MSFRNISRFSDWEGKGVQVSTTKRFFKMLKIDKKKVFAICKFVNEMTFKLFCIA